MILKRPYAFLIKHFKMIHLLLLVIMGYVAYKHYQLLEFYDLYIAGKVSLVSPHDYINIIMFIAIVLGLIICIAIYYLMKYKQKKRFLYILLMMVYIFIFIIFLIARSNLNTLMFQILDQKTIRLIRDIVRIAFWIDIVFLFPVFVRALGFNIKKFDFDKDLIEFGINSSDNEEVEVNLGVDTKKIARGGRKSLRELRYYYQENKRFINLIVIPIIVIAIILLVTSIIKSNKVYQEKEVINGVYTSVIIDDVYATDYDKNKNYVSKNNNTFVIVDLQIKSNYNNNYILDTNKFFITINKDKYFPSKKYYNYFTNLGIGYKNQVLDYQNYKSYILVYTIPNDLLDKKIILNYEETLNNSYIIKIDIDSLDK